MKCPNGIRVCPNNWNDCSLCAHEQACNAGLYHGEPPVPEPEPQLANELTEPELTTDLGTPMPSERGTWYEKFMAMSENERWREIARYPTPHFDTKEPIPLDGPSSPGGGGKCKVPKKPKKKMPEYLKTWGT